MTALEYFRLLAPAYENETDEVVSQFLTLAASRFSVCGAPDDIEAQVQALGAAHLMALRDRSYDGSSGGFITSEREGDLSRSYGRHGGAFSATIYGDQLEDLLNQYCGPCILTRLG